MQKVPKGKADTPETPAVDAAGAGAHTQAHSGPADGHVRRLVYVARQHDESLTAHLREAGWEVVAARTPARAEKAVACGVSTAGFIDLSGFAPRDLSELEACLKTSPLGWVATAKSRQLADPTVRRLISQYCFDYVTLPIPWDRFAERLGHALGMGALGAEVQIAEGTSHDAMIGECDAMRQLFRAIRKIATSHAPVFISGESGTGKELTARAIHEHSPRRGAPFVALNCGAIPHHLLQAELFGYEAGAFTGATQRRTGRVEAAEGGTLFLDEIGDMPIEAQASLLRFLQEGKIERLGGLQSVPVNVRVISATHVNLEDAVREGRFREDLFHRLCVLRIDEPPLRERGADIELLANHMLARFRSDSTRRIRGFTPDAIEAMRTYCWPGNVRELINRVRRAIVLAEHRLISAHDLELRPADEGPMTLAQVREAAEKRAIEAALLRRRNRVGEAAEALGVSRITLYRLMNAYGMRAATDDAMHDAAHEPSHDPAHDGPPAAPADGGTTPDAGAPSGESGNAA